MKIRILYIVSTLQKSGPTTQLYGLISTLPKEKYVIKIITLSPEPQESRWNEFVSLGVEADSLNMNRVEGMFFAGNRLRDVINRFKPNIVHSSGIRSDLLICRMRIGVSWCATIHSYCIDYPLQYGRIKGRIMAWLHLRTIKKMRHPICCSLSLKHLYEQILHRPMYAVQNGISIDRFRFEDEKRQRLRETYGIGEEEIVYITVGNLLEVKDPLTVIKAFNLLKKEKVHLYIIGDGVLRKTCQEIADSKVIFTGRIENVEEYLLLSDVYISASISEGLPTSVLEAGAAGLPMILSDIPQHREIWNNESKYIHFFNVGDVATLEQKMNIMKEMRSNNQTREIISKSIISRFSSEKMGWEYQKFYDYMFEKINQSERKSVSS